MNKEIQERKKFTSEVNVLLFEKIILLLQKKVVNFKLF
jgi:hypothetical protein